MSLRDKYGPWAVIAGASEGTGRAFAMQLAADGVNCVLLSSRVAGLDELADELRKMHCVDCVTASVDLSTPEAFEGIKAAVGAREIGLYIHNAGGDPEGEHFLDLPAERWIDQINRGIVTLMQCSHHFGGAMRARGRGGLLLIGSGACWGGSAHMATYSGLKAFALNFAEGLWSELHGAGVDVLYAALGQTDTPEFRRFLAAHGMPVPDGLADPAKVAALALERLAHGPLLIWGQEDEEAGRLPQSAAQRRVRAAMISAATKGIFGK